MAISMEDRVRRGVEALELLGGADIESMERDELDSVIAARGVIIAFTDSIELRIARRSRRLAEQGRSEDAADVLRDGGRRSGRAAAAAAGREEACEQLPSFGDALGDGTVTSGHLDALANANSKLDDEQKQQLAAREQELLAKARNSTVEAFERSCRNVVRELTADDGSADLAAKRRRSRVRTWFDQNTGMGQLHAELDPEWWGKVTHALNARLQTLLRQQRDLPDDDPAGKLTVEQTAAQAFVELICGSTVLDRRVPEVTVIVDLDTLVNGLHDHTVCETATGVDLPPSIVRRYACSADIIPVVLNGDGIPVDVGAASRLATPAQRRATMAMYATCSFPNCPVPIDRCELHHVNAWSHHHRTDLEDLTPLCCRHHHTIHEGGWALTMTPDRIITIHRPDGSRYYTGDTRNRRANAA